MSVIDPSLALTHMHYIDKNSIGVFLMMPSDLSYFSLHIKSDSVESVRGVLGRWGKKVGEATKKAEVLAGNTWQHREFPFIF